MYWRDTAGNTIVETDGTGSDSNANYTEYVFFQGQRIAEATPYASIMTPYYYFSDQLGSTRLVTDSSGNPCYEADFLPYGTENTPASFTNTCFPNYKFTGYERDGETGNDYAVARYYSSGMQRFLSPDPLGGSSGDPQSFNRYAYARNNPINRIDPTGQDDFDDGGDGDDPFDYYSYDTPVTFYGLDYTLGFINLKFYPVPSSAGDSAVLDGESNGIPNGLNVPNSGPPLGASCTYGGGFCGGMIYGITPQGGGPGVAYGPPWNMAVWVFELLRTMPQTQAGSQPQPQKQSPGRKSWQDFAQRFLPCYTGEVIRGTIGNGGGNSDAKAGAFLAVNLLAVVDPNPFSVGVAVIYDAQIAVTAGLTCR